MAEVTGTFTVDAFDAEPLDGDDGLLARVRLGKTFDGGLIAASVVHMTSARTSVDNSAGYVAIERVVGVLDGLDGSFVLQHSGTSARGQQSLSVVVVPDSGTGSLVGLTGEMVIGADLPGGGHEFTFRYDL